MTDETKAVANLAELGSKIMDTVNGYLEPVNIRRRAKAEVDAAMIRAEGQTKLLELEERARARVSGLELRRQRNIDAIIEQAGGHRPSGPVSSKAVDEDWVSAFFDCSQDVSNERMQSVWSRILAGEVARPGTFSLRALSAVRLLAFDDANLFSRFCAYVWETPDGPVSVLPFLSDDRSVTVGPADLLNLRTLGLVAYESATLMTWQARSKDVEVSYFGRRWRVCSATKDVAFDTFVFLSGVGAELAKIAGAQENTQYQELVVEHWRGTGLQVTEIL